MQLYCDQIGAGSRVLLLLHGMAGNGEVWRAWLEALGDRWPGKILVPDLRGHGRSPHGGHYGFGQHAADVARLIDPGERVTVIGHSMGALVALALASTWFGIEIDAILGFAIRINFDQTDLDKLRSIAEAPVRWYPTRAEAAQRFLRLSGLTDLVAETSSVVSAGVREVDGRWRVAADPRIFTAVGPRFEDLFRVAKTRIYLACGSEDPMVKIEELRHFDPDAVEIPGMGHNFHVHAPRALAAIFDQLL